MEIRLPIYDIVVTTDDGPFGPQCGGDIGSKFPETADNDQRTLLAGIERLILAHACSGVNITTPAYVRGDSCGCTTCSDVRLISGK